MSNWIENGVWKISTLQLSKVENFLKSKKSLLSCTNSSNSFLIGNKGNEIYVFHMNDNSKQFSCDSFHVDILSKITDGGANYHWGVKNVFSVNFKTNISHNRDIMDKLINDKEIDFPPSSEAYKYYFKYEFKKTLQAIDGKIYGDCNFDNIYLNNHVNYINSLWAMFDNELAKSWEVVNHSSVFSLINSLKIYNDKIDYDLWFYKFMNSDKFSIAYATHMKNIVHPISEDYVNFHKILINQYGYSVLASFKPEEIIPHLKRYWQTHKSLK